MDVAVLFSGGKDSAYATYLTKQRHNIKFLVTMIPESRESYMFHYPNVELTTLQSELMGINHIKVRTLGEKEKELDDLKNALKTLDIQGVVSGAVESQYQKSRVDKICKELKLRSIAPLWHCGPKEMLEEQLKAGFKTIITWVSAEGLDKSWLGREIDSKCIQDLGEVNKKHGVHIAGEGGEFCTFVLNCPLFETGIKVKKAKKVWEGDRGYYLIQEVGLWPRKKK